MSRGSALVSGLLVAMFAFATRATAQIPTTDTTTRVLSSGFGDAVDQEVARVRDATIRFKTSAKAEAAGYKRVTDCVEHGAAGAMGYHFQNNALLDTTLDLAHPEVLVYEKESDGAFKLNGVEFLVPISAWKAVAPPRIMGQSLKKADSLGIWYLHVWTWAPNPSGLFADWNPNVTCGDASSRQD